MQNLAPLRGAPLVVNSAVLVAALVGAGWAAASVMKDVGMKTIIVAALNEWADGYDFADIFAKLHVTEMEYAYVSKFGQTNVDVRAFLAG